jgi:hypothetical protein
MDIVLRVLNCKSYRWLGNESTKPEKTWGVFKCNWSEIIIILPISYPEYARSQVRCWYEPNLWTGIPAGYGIVIMHTIIPPNEEYAFAPKFLKNMLVHPGDFQRHTLASCIHTTGTARLSNKNVSFSLYAGSSSKMQ